MHLSDKAKGKQRASDSGTSQISPQSPSKKLIVRFTDGVADLTIHVAEKDTVGDVKLSIRDSRPQLKNRRLRLIHSGRLLTEKVELLPSLASVEDRQCRATTEEMESTPDIQASSMWLHCSIGPEMEEGEEEDDNKTQSAQLKPLRGFDRLAAAGFTESDIANFRQQFHSQSSANYLDSELVDENDEDYDEHARALEEQWIDNLDNSGLSNSSASSPVIQGLLIGFFFPLIPFFFLFESRPAVFWENGQEHETTGTVIFSKRIQVSIVVGFIINLILGAWRYLLSS